MPFCYKKAYEFFCNFFRHKRSNGCKIIIINMNIQKLNEGTGPLVPQGSMVKVHYTGKFTDGRVFDSSVSRGKPLEFKIGVGQVIRGWDEGITKLQVGQKAEITCPPDFAYGSQGAGGVIPPNATLIFDVEVISF